MQFCGFDNCSKCSIHINVSRSSSTVVFRPSQSLNSGRPYVFHLFYDIVHILSRRSNQVKYQINYYCLSKIAILNHHERFSLL